MCTLIKLDDLSCPEAALYRNVPEIQLYRMFEPEPGVFIAESPKVISRALDAGYTPLSFLGEKKQFLGEGRPILERCPDVPAYAAAEAVLRGIGGYPMTRGMLCAMRRRRPAPVREFLEKELRGAKRIAILENVVNPTNIGAIFRSAAALGADGVLLAGGCCDPLYRRASRVSMGTVFQIPWTVFGKDCPWPGEGLALLKELGFITCALALRDDSLPLDAPVLGRQERLALLLGTEGNGLSAETIAACDYTVRIPMSHGVDSLNVAAASAVAFWQLCALPQR